MLHMIGAFVVDAQRAAKGPAYRQDSIRTVYLLRKAWPRVCRPAPVSTVPALLSLGVQGAPPDRFDEREEFGVFYQNIMWHVCGRE